MPIPTHIRLTGDMYQCGVSRPLKHFASNSKIASAWTKANRVYKDDGKTIDYQNCTEDYKKMRTAFDAQDKIVTFQAFVWSCINVCAVVVPTSTSDSSSSTSGNTGGNRSENSGGSENPDDGGDEQVR